MPILRQPSESDIAGPELPSLVVPPPSPRAASVNRTSTVRMKVLAPLTDDAPPSGRMLDAVDFAESARVPLELGAMPAGRAQALGRPPTPLPTPKTPHVPFTPVGASEVVRRSGLLDPRRPGIFAFAGFGLPPESIAGAPTYALRVLARTRVLRNGLAIARRQRSADIELYEAALRMADRNAYVKGLGMLGGGALLVVAFLGVLSAILLA